MYVSVCGYLYTIYLLSLSSGPCLPMRAVKINTMRLYMMYSSLHIHTYTYTHIYIYTYTHIYTHTHMKRHNKINIISQNYKRIFVCYQSCEIFFNTFHRISLKVEHSTELVLFERLHLLIHLNLFTNI